MKKIIMLIAILILAGMIRIYAVDVQQMITEGLTNGNYLMDAINSDEEPKIACARCFTLAILECMSRLKPNVFKKYYEGISTDEAFNSVVNYYKKNPAQRHRPIVDVLLSGCK